MPSSAYVIETDVPFSTPEQWAEDLCEAPRQRRSREILGELDQPANIARAQSYLTDHPPAIQGAGGDDHTYKTACRLFDFGLSEPTVLDLLLGPWNERCQPPWPPDEMQKKVENAATFKTGATGKDDAAVEFAAVPIPANENQKRGRLYGIPARDAEPKLDQVALIDDWLGQGAMSVAYGQSNVGKTFVAMDMAWAVAAGRQWHTHDVRQGAVAYIAAEAGISALKRVKALRLAKGPDDPPFMLVPCPIDLLHDNGDTIELIDLLKRAEDMFGQGLALAVVDTFSRALAGGNENDSADMGAMVKHLDRVRTALGCHLLTVHHSGKDQAKGARGHSLLRAATDTEIEIANNRIRATKQRDQEAGKPVGFTLRSVPIGVDSRQRIITSAVIDTFPPVDAIEVPMPRAGTKAEQALQTLSALLGASGVDRVPMTRWRQELRLTVLGASWREEFKRLVAVLEPHLVFTEDRESVGLCRLISVT